MVLMHVLVLMGCAVGPPEPVPEPVPHWISRSDAELQSALTQACEASQVSQAPILLEFSAPWCIDCRKLEALDEASLAGEYERWERLRIDVGRFDRHEALREAFGVYAIAHWVALDPTQGCSSSAERWTRLKQSTIEIETGSLGPRTADDLVRWLQEARGQR
jgi:thiol-disulfide isomerase/thioredoxin